MAGTIKGAPPGGALQSEAAPAPATAANLPNIAPEPDFIYFHNPVRWDVFTRADGTQELLPVLSKLKLDPGVGGVDENGNPVRAKAARMNKGEIEIPRTYVEETDYVQRLRVRNGWLYHERWRQFLRVGSQFVERADTEGYLAWLHDVAATLPAPLPEILEGRQEIYRAKLTRQIEAAAGNPLKTLSVEKTQDRIDTLETFKEALAEGATTVPAAPAKKPTLAQKLKASVTPKRKLDPTDVPDAEG